mmetsp:Transcript_54580/g.144236  ORF Transcript_54580/g.144236 Transcript_54580/m.144236 type:complete len:81 (-) Transcript_54580:259-501(-)
MSTIKKVEFGKQGLRIMSDKSESAFFARNSCDRAKFNAKRRNSATGDQRLLNRLLPLLLGLLRMLLGVISFFFLISFRSF